LDCDVPGSCAGSTSEPSCASSLGTPEGHHTDRSGIAFPRKSRENAEQSPNVKWGHMSLCTSLLPGETHRTPDGRDAHPKTYSHTRRTGTQYPVVCTKKKRPLLSTIPVSVPRATGATQRRFRFAIVSRHKCPAFPPKGQSDFSGQLLKLRRALYGGKQSAYLWYTMMNEFLLELGFLSSPLDSCFYRRLDVLLILYCDDLRIGASQEVLASLHASLVSKFDVTTAPGTRLFLRMDTIYDFSAGTLKLSMTSYIETTVARFAAFDLSQGLPYRELVGCLLWITLSVFGPELLRVKGFARKSNKFIRRIGLSHGS
jgi:hypothetical protein